MERNRVNKNRNYFFTSNVPFLGMLSWSVPFHSVTYAPATETLSPSFAVSIESSQRLSFIFPESSSIEKSHTFFEPNRVFTSLTSPFSTIVPSIETSLEPTDSSFILIYITLKSYFSYKQYYSFWAKHLYVCIFFCFLDVSFFMFLYLWIESILCCGFFWLYWLLFLTL